VLGQQVVAMRKTGERLRRAAWVFLEGFCGESRNVSYLMGLRLQYLFNRILLSSSKTAARAIEVR
jgi:hypothetical protein